MAYIFDIDGHTIPKPIVIVDVDETLWPFHDAVVETGKSMGVKVPQRCECDGWNVIYKYSNKENIIKVFNDVHSRQGEYYPYLKSHKLLKFLRKKYYVIIASHRLDIYKDELVKWLDKNGLEYDEVTVSMDKTSLFANPNVALVIDDRADTLVAAHNHGKMGIGLKKPWNEKFIDEKNLFNTLYDIEVFLK
jgi:hypothetical protein